MQLISIIINERPCQATIIASSHSTEIFPYFAYRRSMTTDKNVFILLGKLPIESHIAVDGIQVSSCDHQSGTFQSCKKKI